MKNKINQIQMKMLQLQTLQKNLNEECTENAFWIKLFLNIQFPNEI